MIKDYDDNIIAIQFRDRWYCTICEAYQGWGYYGDFVYVSPLCNTRAWTNCTGRKIRKTASLRTWEVLL